MGTHPEPNIKLARHKGLARGRDRGRGIGWLNCLLGILLMVVVALTMYTLFEMSETVKPGESSLDMGLRSMQQLSLSSLEAMQKISADSVNSLMKEVDHMYHYLTDTNDDDGHVQINPSGEAVPKEHALAALSGEELLESNSSEVIMEGGKEEAGEEDAAVALPPQGDHPLPLSPAVSDAKYKGLDQAGGDAASAEEALDDVEMVPRGEVAEALPADGEGGIVGGEDGAEDIEDEAADEEDEDEEEEEASGPGQLLSPQQGGGTTVTNSSAAQGSASFADKFMAAKRELSKAHTPCGGMPKSFGPKFTEQKEPPVRTRVYPSKPGTVVPFNLAMKPEKVPTEHGKRGNRKATNKRSLKRGEQPLVDCLNNLGKCTPASMRAALSLRGMREALSSSKRMLQKRFRSCAVVGNSGGMMHQKYGPYIDKHDFVMRINALPMQKHIDHLGTKVNARVLSYKISKDVCCLKKDYVADNPDLEYYIWFPAAQKQVAARMKKSLKTNPVKIMPKPFLKSAVLSFKAFRGELLRLGYGPFEDWEYMTSGMHAAFGLIKSCDNVDLYGFTTDMNNKGPYWFTGRAAPPRSGQTQHAWDHERMVLRLMHAAGAINVCTS